MRIGSMAVALAAILALAAGHTAAQSTAHSAIGAPKQAGAPAASSASYQLDWAAAGTSTGDFGASPNYRLSTSIGMATAGTASESPAYRACLGDSMPAGVPVGLRADGDPLRQTALSAQWAGVPSAQRHPPDRRRTTVPGFRHPGSAGDGRRGAADVVRTLAVAGVIEEAAVLEAVETLAAARLLEAEYLDAAVQAEAREAAEDRAIFAEAS